MDGAIDELKLKLKSDNGQQSVDLYNREKNMIVGMDLTAGMWPDDQVQIVYNHGLSDVIVTESKAGIKCYNPN